MKKRTQNEKLFIVTKKEKQVILIVTAVIILLLSSVCLIKSKGFIFLLVKHDQEHLTAMANAIIESGEESPEHSWYFSDVDYYDSIKMVAFTTSYWGVAPSSVKKGFYYSPQNIPLGYHYGEVVSFLPYEEGWLWKEEDGNNTIYTEKIVDYWFWFEERT